MNASERLRNLLLAAALVPLAWSSALAEVRSKRIEYKDGDTVLEGYLAWDDSIEGKRPAVLVVHEWWGLNDYARKRAGMLAELGYVAFALDMYGRGKTTKHPSEAGAWAREIRQNVKAWRRRALAGLKVLAGHDKVDSERMAAIGYCFGGATVLQLAYGGADVLGVVSFHGSLPLPEPDEAEAIGPGILVCHGADDSFIPDEQIRKFRKALDEGDADWHMVYYGGARHSFTNPAADRAGLDGLRYDRKADERSWRHMRSFLRELFDER